MYPIMSTIFKQFILAFMFSHVDLSIVPSQTTTHFLSHKHRLFSHMDFSNCPFINLLNEIPVTTHAHSIYSGVCVWSWELSRLLVQSPIFFVRSQKLYYFLIPFQSIILVISHACTYTHTHTKFT